MRRLALVALVAVVAILAGGCKGAATKTRDTTVLRVAFLTDMSVPDPDVFYDTEGNSLILSVYEGLLKYAPDSTKIVPSLATSYKISADGLTYTFALRQGVRFHDGTPLTAAAVKASLERRTAVAGAPSYMLGKVKRISLPDDHTVVVQLAQRVGPFLHYLASSWGPKIIGPKAIKDNARKDFGQKYLQTHGDGTGPYRLSGFARGRTYTLTRNPMYWGSKPAFATVLIKIEPSISAQRVQLAGGDLDAIMHAFPVSELKTLGSGIKVVQKPSLLRSLLYVNTNRPPFSNPVAREAVTRALNIDSIVKEVYAGTARPATGPYQPQILTNQPGHQETYDPAQAKSLAARAGGPRDITLGYSADEPLNRRTSELLQLGLEQAGFRVTLKAVPVAQLYDYINHPKKGPDLLIGTYAPDAAHPDAWSRIVWRSGGGLNLLGYSDPKVDALIDRAGTEQGAAAEDLYRQIGRRIEASNAFISLANVDDVFLLAKSLTAGEHFTPYPWLLDYASVKRTG
jgi:peptide/nickel transport system substrate-binding protein